MNNRKFKVKVNVSTRGFTSFLYWTWSGSAVNIEDAAVFTEGTVPALFSQSLQNGILQGYIEKIYIEEEG